MNKIEFKRLIKTLVKEEMAKKNKMMEYENLPFSKSYPEIEGDKYGYNPEEDVEKSSRKKSFGEKTMDAVYSIVAILLGKKAEDVTSDEVKLYKKLKK
jgi:hypothetical protein